MKSASALLKAKHFAPSFLMSICQNEEQYMHGLKLMKNFNANTLMLASNKQITTLNKSSMKHSPRMTHRSADSAWMLSNG